MIHSNKSIVWKLVLPVPVILVVTVLAVWLTVPRIVAENARATAVLSATHTVNLFKTLRSYYTKNVVKKVLADGNLSLSFNHKAEPKSLPLPATVMHDMSELLAKEDTTINLYSAYPFPNRSDRVLDNFQKEAWDRLVANPDQVFTRRETRHGSEIVRVAIADFMVAEPCISCHNSHPDSPKTDWKMGDVRGILEVDVAIGDQLAAGARLSDSIILVAALGGGLLIGVSVVAARRVTAPLIRMTKAMDRLSTGDENADIPDQERNDEIGAMARALEIFKEYAVRIRQSETVLQGEVTQRQRAQEKLKSYAGELERSNRELQDFAQVASHDLQEPLRKIQAFGGRLKRKYNDKLGDEGRDYVARMLDASGRMSELIRDLLSFSRVTSKAEPFAPVDLSKIMRGVLSDLEVRIQETGGRVEVDDFPTIAADRRQMRQLFQNLVGNALKFHREGEPPVVKVRCNGPEDGQEKSNGHAAANGECRISVEDNGIGFDQQYADRIFTIFERLHGRNDYQGTGIGLAVCRKIVERHGGVISATGAPEKGAIFTVVLPTEHAQEDSVQEDNPS